MRSHREWQSFGRRFQEAVGQDQLREFVAETLVAIDVFVVQLTNRARAPENAGWVRGCRRRSRTECVA